MRYIYVFLMIIGILSSLVSVFFLVIGLFDSQGANALNESLRFLIMGLVFIALGDIGSKLSNLQKDFDYFLNQQRRPPPQFFEKTDNESES